VVDRLYSLTYDGSVCWCAVLQLQGLVVVHVLSGLADTRNASAPSSNVDIAEIDKAVRKDESGKTADGNLAQDQRKREEIPSDAAAGKTSNKDDNAVVSDVARQNIPKADSSAEKAADKIDTAVQKDNDPSEERKRQSDGAAVSDAVEKKAAEGDDDRAAKDADKELKEEEKDDADKELKQEEKDDAGAGNGKEAQDDNDDDEEEQADTDKEDDKDDTDAETNKDRAPAVGNDVAAGGQDAIPGPDKTTGKDAYNADRINYGDNKETAESEKNSYYQEPRAANGRDTEDYVDDSNFDDMDDKQSRELGERRAEDDDEDDDGIADDTKDAAEADVPVKDADDLKFDGHDELPPKDDPGSNVLSTVLSSKHALR